MRTYRILADKWGLLQGNFPNISETTELLAIPLTDLEKCRVDCPECGGTGDGKHDPIEETLPCERCGGTGKVVNFELPGSVIC